jgi:hypothetical protein
MTPERFAASHRLTAIVLNGEEGGGFAVVDGKILHLGATLDGLTLRSLTRQVAIFEGAGVTAPLRVNPATENRD